MGVEDYWVRNFCGHTPHDAATVLRELGFLQQEPLAMPAPRGRVAHDARSERVLKAARIQSGSTFTARSSAAGLVPLAERDWESRRLNEDASQHALPSWMHSMHAGLAIAQQESSIAAAEESFFTYENTQHIVEAEIIDTGLSRCTVLIRFALCQAQTIDMVYIDLVVKLAARTKGTVVLEGWEPDADPQQDTYRPPYWGYLREAILRSIRRKRALWREDFGTITAKATCREAVERFVYGRLGNK